SFVIGEPGLYSWWLELIDERGFESTDPPRYEVRAIADLEPDVRIDQPATNLFITPDARVAVQATARDDLGLAGMRLVYLRAANGGGDSRLPPPRKVIPGDSPLKPLPLFDGEGRPLERVVGHLWNIAELGVSPGTRMAFRVEATDDFDL